MEIEKDFARLRKRYMSYGPSERFWDRGWFELQGKLEGRSERPVFMSLFARGLVFAGFVLIVLGGAFFGLTKAAQASHPGDLLYPVKRFSENITVAVSRNRDIKVENRAQEIIDLANEEKNPDLLKKATEEYKKTVDETKKNVEQSGDREKLRRQLQIEEQHFEDVIKQNPSIGEDLNEALKVSREGQDGNNGEVKGKHEKGNGSDFGRKDTHKDDD